MFFCKVGYFKYMATVSNCQIKSQLAIWLSTVTSFFRPGGCQLVNIHDLDVQLKCMQDHSLIYFGLFMKSTDTEKKITLPASWMLSNLLYYQIFWSSVQCDPTPWLCSCWSLGRPSLQRCRLWRRRCPLIWTEWGWTDDAQSLWDADKNRNCWFAD